MGVPHMWSKHPLRGVGMAGHEPFTSVLDSKYSIPAKKTMIMFDMSVEL